MGLFSSITKIFTGGQKAKAAKQAATAEATGLGQGITTLTDQNEINKAALNQALAALAPYTAEGGKAVTAQGDLLGLNGGDAQGSAINGLQDSPLFASLMRNGQNSILSNASATGGLRGGNIQSSLANFGSDTLANVIQNQLSNLGGLTTTGLSAAGTGVNATVQGNTTSTNIADQVADYLKQQGVVQAGGILGKLSGHLEQDAGVSGVVSTLAQAALAAMGGTPGGSNMASTAMKFI